MNRDGWVFIANPTSGNGQGAEVATTARAQAERRGVHAEFAFTEAKGHGAELARQYVERGFRHVIAIGGDGTAHDVVQGLAHEPSVTFGLVPAGTGNDFIEVLGFSARFTDSEWTALFDDHVIAMDLGRCNGHVFLNGMGLGMDAQVAAENYSDAQGSEIKGGSKSKYLWHILKTILTYEEPRVRVSHSGMTEERHLFLNAINLGRRVAGGLYLTPDARPDDGLLDVCWVERLGRAARLYELARVVQRAHTKDARVRVFQTDALCFEFDEEVPAHLDGEVMHARRFEVSIRPRALRVLYNPEGPNTFLGQPAVPE